MDLALTESEQLGNWLIEREWKRDLFTQYAVWVYERRIDGLESEISWVDKADRSILNCNRVVDDIATIHNIDRTELLADLGWDGWTWRFECLDIDDASDELLADPGFLYSVDCFLIHDKKIALAMVKRGMMVRKSPVRWEMIEKIDE